MKTKLSSSRFYLSNIIFYTCLLAFPSSSAIEQKNQTESSKPSTIDRDNEWLKINKIESIDEGSSPKLTGYEQIMALINKLSKKNEQLEKGNEQLKEKVAEFESMLSMMISIEPKREDGMTSFLCAARKGQLGIAKLLRQLGANLNAKDKNGDNALHLACLFSGSVEMVEWLLDECKIGIETKGYGQKTPFLVATEKGQLEIAKLLKKQGANINAKNNVGYNALYYACKNSGSIAMVTWLLDECKIGIETKGFNQKTPFLCATEKGQLAIAKLLKKRGADINAKNELGNNALHFACLCPGSVEMVTWLLDECKIGLETKGQYQRIPFLFAVQGGQLGIAKLLEKRGANINAKDEDGNNALHLACYLSGNVPMVTWLLDKCKINIEAKGEDERTPFLYAAWKGRLPIAKLLKERCANINAKDKYGNNALNLASSGNEEMITWLSNVCKLKKTTRLSWFTNWFELHDLRDVFGTFIAVFLVFCLSGIKG